MFDRRLSQKIFFLLVTAILVFAGMASAASRRPLSDKPEPATPAELKLGAPGGEEWQFFRINAQYRGTVKKSFSGLGCAIAWFKDLSPDQTQAIIHVCVKHPEKRQQTYAFRLNLVFSHSGADYRLVKTEYATFTGINGDHQAQLQQLAALWAYMRTYAAGGKIYPAIEACGARLNLAELLLGKGRTREVDCSWQGRRGFHGKFFFERAIDPVFKEVLALDKLRFRSGKLSVSLVKDTQSAVLRDFAGKEPFATSVFK